MEINGSITEDKRLSIAGKREEETQTRVFNQKPELTSPEGNLCGLWLLFINLFLPSGLLYLQGEEKAWGKAGF